MADPAKWRVIHGDCIEAMAAMPESIVDAIVTDPPYGLEFMGREWDKLSGPQWGGDSKPWEERPKGGVDPFAKARPRYGTAPVEMQAWHEAWAREALRVLKPGGHLLAFGGTRTYHRLACAIEDAGFEIRDSFLYWGYGSGFPKSLSPYRSMLSQRCPSHANAKHAVLISPSIPVRSNGAKVAFAPALVETHPEGELALLIPTGRVDGFSAPMVIGPSALKTVGMNLSIVQSWQASSDVILNGTSTSITETVTRATIDPRILSFCRSLPMPPIITPEEWRPDGCSCDVWPVVESLSDGEWSWSDTPLLTAREPVIAPLLPLKGLGTAAKPSYEPIVVARKPLTGTVAGNVLAYGTGALNVDGCRIGGDKIAAHGGGRNSAGRIYGNGEGVPALEAGANPHVGRWPANVVLDEQAAAMLDEQTGTLQSGSRAEGVRTGLGYHGASGDGGPAIIGDSGGASRFLYVAKASSAERNAGLDGFEASPEKAAASAHSIVCAKCNRQRVNVSGACACPAPEWVRVQQQPRANVHPTVKPIALMRWLVRLVTPPAGKVLDPFAGSGTTGIAAALEGFDFVGIEREAEYAAIAEARIAWWARHPDGMTLVKRLEAETDQKVRADLGQATLFA